jgi:integrative and conjugative element protein (TIGR02256 family)
MTQGQELAIEQLRAIETADATVFEIIKTLPPSMENPLLRVVVGLNCRGLECVADGLPLREREKFTILIPPDFPFSIPHIWSTHERFAGKPHVQWKRHLCIYQAPQTEWDSSDGMFGFIDRLWTWLEHGAKNLADPVGLPIHPPVAYTGESKYVIVPRADAPEITDRPWYGFAGIQSINDRALALVNWQPASNPGDPTAPVAAVILLPNNLPWEMPTKLEDLCKELEASGMRRELLLTLLKWTMLVNPKDYPLFVVVGSPQRGIQSADLKHHLMVWQVSGLVLDFLNLSADWIRLQFRLDGFDTPDSEALRQEAKAHQARVEQLAMESIKLVDVNWCNVLEDRPEIITRRDERSPLEAFRARHVCLWGCGALGSHVAYYLVKAGVKKLTMLDNGTIKPGLLVRQMFEESELGEAKALALKRRLERMDPGVEIAAIQKSVFDDPTVTDWGMGADVIIDCTASDMVHAKSELPRSVEGQKRPPIISMIIGPRAERGVVVVTNSDAAGAIKDAFRKAKLTACQRPELSAFLGDFYPKGDAVKIFQPEPGCSDPTFEGSCADAAGLSALLLNAGARMLKSYTSSSAACFICQPHVVSEKSGEVAFAEFSFEQDIVCQNDYQIRFSPRAWREMAAAIRQVRRKRRPESETGGLLFGKRDDALRVIWVDDAIGPPPDSVCSPEKFVCGVKGTQEATRKRKKQFRGSVEFVGMWHTHPQDVPLPSTTDLSGMAQILTSGDAPPLRSLLVIVGWARGEILLGTSVFNRALFQNGTGTVAVAVHHFPDLKL